MAALDAPGRALVFDDGSRLAYDKLLLAVGPKGRPAPWPGADGPGLHSFVTLRDLEALDREARADLRAPPSSGAASSVSSLRVFASWSSAGQAFSTGDGRRRTGRSN